MSTQSNHADTTQSVEIEEPEGGHQMSVVMAKARVFVSDPAGPLRSGCGYTCELYELDDDDNEKSVGRVEVDSKGGWDSYNADGDRTGEGKLSPADYSMTPTDLAEDIWNCRQPMWALAP